MPVWKGNDIADAMSQNIDADLRQQYYDSLRHLKMTPIFKSPMPSPPPNLQTGISTFQASISKMFTSEELFRMIAMRMHWTEGRQLPWEFFSAYKVKEEKVLVFIVKDGQAILLEDEWPMFPSDVFITKLRLL